MVSSMPRAVERRADLTEGEGRHARTASWQAGGAIQSSLLSEESALTWTTREVAGTCGRWFVAALPGMPKLRRRQSGEEPPLTAGAGRIGEVITDSSKATAERRRMAFLRKGWWGIATRIPGRCKTTVSF